MQPAGHTQFYTTLTDATAVGRDGDDFARLETTSILRIVSRFFPNKCSDRVAEAVLSFCLLNHLVSELMRRTDVNNALVLSPVPPLCYQGSYKRLTATGWQLNCDIWLAKALLLILIKNVALVRQKPLKLSIAEIQKHLLRSIK